VLKRIVALVILVAMPIGARPERRVPCVRVVDAVTSGAVAGAIVTVVSPRNGAKPYATPRHILVHIVAARHLHGQRVKAAVRPAVPAGVTIVADQSATVALACKRR